MFVICAKVFLFFFLVLFENKLFGVNSKLFCFIEIRLFCMRSAFYVDVLLWCDNIPTLSELFKSKTHICLTSRNINRGRLWTLYLYCIDLVLSCDSISCFCFAQSWIVNLWVRLEIIIAKHPNSSCAIFKNDISAAASPWEALCKLSGKALCTSKPGGASLWEPLCRRLSVGAPPAEAAL